MTMTLSEIAPNLTSDNIPSSPLHGAIAHVVLSIFRRKQKERMKDKFFSPVILYFVLSSIKLDRGLILANSITHAHAMLKKYHMNGYVTPARRDLPALHLKIIAQTDMLSKQLGQLTHWHFSVHLRITAFQKLVSFWLTQHVSPALKNLHAVIDEMECFGSTTEMREIVLSGGEVMPPSQRALSGRNPEKTGSVTTVD
ncbi:hypothetical protein C8R44DRAFT_867512 [Mycena epipterygia]|nr:hypothetical protein C8R44DRAFT_867512 [Mycena epipterygia]